MENCNIIHSFSIFKTSNFITLLVAYRVATTCHNYASCCVIFPLNINLIKSTVYTSLKNFHKVSFKSRKYNLSFRVSKTCIVFNNFHTLWSKHKSKENNALESSTFFIKSINCWLINCLHTFFGKFLCVYSTRRESTHTTCIKTFVIIISSLMVLSRYHRNNSLTIAERKYRHFRTS